MSVVRFHLWPPTCFAHSAKSRPTVFSPTAKITKGTPPPVIQHASTNSPDSIGSLPRTTRPALATNVFCAKRKITADSVFANGENHERHPPTVIQHASTNSPDSIGSLPRTTRPALATNVFCAKRKITAGSVFANGENHERHPPSNTTCVNEPPPFLMTRR